MFSIKFEAVRSITINKSLDEVHKAISDFSTWINWSPWLCQEKNCSIEREGSPSTIGHWQEWSGERIGSGKMTLTKVEGKNFLEYDLQILKPWKSRSRVTFDLKENDGSTIVTWSMFGSLPIFMFFMKKMMEALIGNDYTRGLSMLKEWMETGIVESDTELKNVVTKPEYYYLGIKHDSSIEDMPGLMTKDFEKLMEYLKSEKIPSPEQVLSYYHDFDMVKGTCSFTSAFAYSKKPNGFDELVEGYFPAHKCAQVVHTGSYQNLGNAWSTVMNYQRCQKLKSNKSVPWYELYINSPHEVKPGELLTEINIPVK